MAVKGSIKKSREQLKQGSKKNISFSSTFINFPSNMSYTPTLGSKGVHTIFSPWGPKMSNNNNYQTRPARLVNPELGWLGGQTESVSFKIWSYNWPKINRLTQLGTRVTRQNSFFFPNVFFLLPRDLFFFFILFSWLLTLLTIHYINTRRMFYFFNVRFETF